MKKLPALGLLPAVAAAAFFVYTRQVRRLVGAANLWLVAKDTPEPQPAHPLELGPSSLYRKLAVFTTGTSGAQPEFRWAKREMLASFEGDSQNRHPEGCPNPPAPIPESDHRQ